MRISDWSSDVCSSDLVVATFSRIINPPEGVSSARKAYYIMVEKVSAPDDHTVVFDLKYPSGAFIPSVAIPFNYIYQKKVLDKDQHWYEQNVMGTGPFKVKDRQPGARISGAQFEHQHRSEERRVGKE